MDFRCTFVLQARVTDPLFLVEAERLTQALLAEQGDDGGAGAGDSFYVMVVLMALVHEAAGGATGARAPDHDDFCQTYEIRSFIGGGFRGAAWLNVLQGFNLTPLNTCYTPLLPTPGRKEASVEVLGALGPVGLLGASSAFLELGLPWLALSALSTLGAEGGIEAPQDLLRKVCTFSAWAAWVSLVIVH